jgi:hypothetical protein
MSLGSLRHAGWMFPLVLVCLPALSQAAPPSIYVMVQASQDKAAEAKYGSGYAASARELIESALFNAFKGKYPCLKYLDTSAAEKMLDVEKQRQLLGAEDEGRLRQLGQSVGARYIASATLTARGGEVTISGVLMDGQSARALGRNTLVSAGGNALSEAIPKFVNGLMSSIGGGGPKCPGAWRGSLSVTITTDARGNDPKTGSFGQSGSTQLNCQVLGTGPDARCTFASKSIGHGPGGSITTTGSAANEPTAVSVSVAGGQLTLRVAPFPVRQTWQSSAGISVEPTIASLGFGPYVMPASSDPVHQSGSWTAPTGKFTFTKTVVSWDLSRK